MTTATATALPTRPHATAAGLTSPQFERQPRQPSRTQFPSGFSYEGRASRSGGFAGTITAAPHYTPPTWLFDVPEGTVQSASFVHNPTGKRLQMIVQNYPGAVEIGYAEPPPALDNAESVVLYNLLRSQFKQINNLGKGLTRHDINGFIGTAAFKQLPAHQQAIYRKYNAHIQFFMPGDWAKVAVLKAN